MFNREVGMMNGADAAVREIMGSGAQFGDPQVISVLEQALAAARSGRLAGVAVVMASGPDGVSLSVAGRHPVALASGAAQLQRQLLDAAFAPKGNRLLVPRG